MCWLSKHHGRVFRFPDATSLLANIAKEMKMRCIRKDDFLSKISILSCCNVQTDSMPVSRTFYLNMQTVGAKDASFRPKLPLNKRTVCVACCSSVRLSGNCTPRGYSDCMMDSNRSDPSLLAKWLQRRVLSENWRNVVKTFSTPASIGQKNGSNFSHNNARPDVTQPILQKLNELATKLTRHTYRTSRRSTTFFACRQLFMWQVKAFIASRTFTLPA